MISIQKGNSKLADYLVGPTKAAGALDSLDGYEAYGTQYNGYTALMMAAKGGLTDVVNKLVEAGARTDIGATYPYEAGVTALMFAIERKQGAAAEILIGPTKAAGALDAKYDCSFRGGNPKSALQLAKDNFTPDDAIRLKQLLDARDLIEKLIELGAVDEPAST